MPERPVRSVLRSRLGPALVTAGPEETVRAAAERMAANCCGSVLIMEGERLLGIFTERDLLARVVAAGLDPAAPPGFTHEIASVAQPAWQRRVPIWKRALR